MTQSLDESPEDLTEDPNKSIRLTLCLDSVHAAALQRISGVAHLKDQQALRHLIRIADRFIQGDRSPFVDRLEGIFPKHKVG